MEPMERLALSWGKCARQFTKLLLSLLSHIGGNGGSPRCCPVLCGLRDRCIAAMLATRTRHEGGVEPPQPGL